jgi:geranylgeranylglycerol-phosphate geranylgeranyltransferase
VRTSPHTKAPIVIKTTRIHSAGSKAKAISDLVKTELPVAAGICVFAGEILPLGGLPTIVEALLGFLTGFFISGSAMISNDYFDLDVDRINHPERPLPSGRITIFELAVLTCLFSVAGFVTAALLGTLTLTLAVVIWVVGILYNWRYKETGLPGNMMVSLSVAMTFIFGGVSVGGVASGVVWTFGALAFIFDLGEEIAGGAMDVRGDEQRSARSLARTRGRKYALCVSGILFVLFVGLSFLPFVMGWLGSVYLALVTATDCAVSWFGFKLLSSRTAEEGRVRIRQLYLTMTFFVIVFIASRFF